MTTTLRRTPVLFVGIVIGLVMGGAELVAGAALWRAALAAAIPMAYALLVTVVARRNETASALAGHPVDERWEHINLEASTWAFGISAIVVLGAFVVAEATNGDWAPYAFIGAVMGLAFIGSLVVVRLRH